MTVALLKEPPLALPADLGPYRRRDYASLPDEPRCELIFGRFYLSPSPSTLHQVVVQLLWRLLDEIADTSGGAAFLAPLDVHLAEHSVVQPDVMYVSASRREVVQRWLEGAPDLVVEVLSPGTSRRDRGEKLRLYSQAGVREYWVVDPAERQIEILTNREGDFVVVLPDGETYRSQAVPEIRLSLPDFWRRVDAKLQR